MSRLVLTRNGGSADEYGHLLGLNRLLAGDVIEGLAVQAQSSPTMNVNVAPGTCRISTGTYPTSYAYFAAVDTTTGTPQGEVVTITTANSSNPRIDTIVAYIDLSVTASTGTANNPNNMLKLIAVAGVAASSPSAPTTSAIQSAIGAANPFIKLANIAVGTSVTQINAGNITSLRAFVQPNSPVILPSSQLTNLYKFSAYRNAAWSSTVGGVVPFETKEYDNSNNLDVTTNVGRFAATVPGFYRFTSSIAIAYGGSGNAFSVALFKNGAIAKSGLQVLSTAAQTIVGQVTATLSLAASDYVDVRSQGVAATGVTGSAYTFFQGELVSAS